MYDECITFYICAIADILLFATLPYCRGGGGFTDADYKSESRWLRFISRGRSMGVFWFDIGAVIRVCVVGPEERSSS